MSSSAPFIAKPVASPSNLVLVYDLRSSGQLQLPPPKACASLKRGLNDHLRIGFIAWERSRVVDSSSLLGKLS